MKSILTVLFVLLSVTAADAARWKTGRAPNGQLERQSPYDGGYCYYDLTDSGPQQCRWKADTVSGVSGCYWERGASTNQTGCIPSTITGVPANAKSTFADPNRSITFKSTPLSNGGWRGDVTLTPRQTAQYVADGTINTWEVDAVIRYGPSGDVLRGRFRWYQPVGTTTVKTLSAQLTSIGTTKSTLRGPLGTSWPIYRTGGATGTPVPPPGGWTPTNPGTSTPQCAYAWNDFVSQQVKCFTDRMSGYWSNAFRSSAAAITVGAWTCGEWGTIVFGATENPALTGVTFGACMEQKIGLMFGTYLINSIFLTTGLTGDLPSTCNSDGMARIRLENACVPH